jgi:uncharacterized membrane protein
MGIGLGEFWTDGTEESADESPWAALPGVRTGAELTRGERVADMVRNRMGSWGFVMGFVAFMCLWAVLNTILLGTNALDPFPYILLNLFLSMLAGLQGAILLIAAKRADAIAAEQALSHLTISRNSSEIIKAVQADLKASHKLVKDVHHILKELHAKESND